jgi:hypothetical protein
MVGQLYAMVIDPRIQIHRTMDHATSWKQGQAPHEQHWHRTSLSHPVIAGILLIGFVNSVLSWQPFPVEGPR